MNGAAAKSCNGCIGCCLTLAVRELNLRSFVGCPHVRALPMAPGCGIYADRPTSCALWNCSWRSEPEWPDELRPDRCGVVFNPIPETVHVRGVETAVIEAYAIPGQENAFERPEVLGAIGKFCEAGYMVLWRIRGAVPGVEQVRVMTLVDDRIGVGPITDTTLPKDQTFGEWASPNQRVARMDKAQRLAREVRKNGR